jgi:hypothetical protein
MTNGRQCMRQELLALWPSDDIITIERKRSIGQSDSRPGPGAPAVVTQAHPCHVLYQGMHEEMVFRHLDKREAPKCTHQLIELDRICDGPRQCPGQMIRRRLKHGTIQWVSSDEREHG